MSDTSQPNPVAKNAEADVEPISGKPSQAEGDEGDSGAASDSDDSDSNGE